MFKLRYLIVFVFILVINLFIFLVYITPRIAIANSDGKYTITYSQIEQYMYTYRFVYDPSYLSNSASSSTIASLKAMVPYVNNSIDIYNRVHHTHVDPRLVVAWSYSEGINGDIRIQNCDGYFFPDNETCFYPLSWQIGYGEQFYPNILNLPEAFRETIGNPNDPTLVSEVGNEVFAMEGLPQNFPHVTISQLMTKQIFSGGSYDDYLLATLGKDPTLSTYLLAPALAPGNFNYWIASSWSPHYSKDWGEISNKFWQVILSWNTSTLDGNVPTCNNVSSDSFCSKSWTVCSQIAYQDNRLSNEFGRKKYSVVSGGYYTNWCTGTTPYCCNIAIDTYIQPKQTPVTFDKSKVIRKYGAQ